MIRVLLGAAAMASVSGAQAPGSSPPTWQLYPLVDAVTNCNAGKPTGYSNASCFHVGSADSAKGCETLVAQLLARGGPATRWRLTRLPLTA